jgi:CHAD domain-containing protein
MNAKTARKIIHARFQSLEVHYKGMRNDLAPHHIHQFRVEIKKLRAFLRLLQTTDEEIKIPEPLKKVYKAAGMVRDLQLHQQHIKEISDKFTIPAGFYIAGLDKQIADAITNLKAAMHPGLPGRAMKEIEKHIPKKITNDSIEGFYNKKMGSIHDISHTVIIHDDQFHNVRKNIKDLLYNSKTFQKDLSQRIPVRGWKKKKEKHLADLAEELGKFQDCNAELAHLQGSQRKTAGEKKLIEILNHKKEKLKDRISMNSFERKPE